MVGVRSPPFGISVSFMFGVLIVLGLRSVIVKKGDEINDTGALVSLEKSQ